MSTVCPLCKSLILLASASVAILEEQKDSHHTLNENYVLKSRLFNGTPLSFAEAPTGYPIKNSNNRKIESNGRWEEGKGGGALFFFLPSLPTTQRGLCGGERRDALVQSSYQQHHSDAWYAPRTILTTLFN